MPFRKKAYDMQRLEADPLDPNASPATGTRRSRERKPEEKRQKSKSRTRSYPLQLVSPSLGAVPARSGLRVKSQNDSLKNKGLCRSEGSKKAVFAFLEVREFPMILGDNPSCVEGPPVTIDWAHDPSTQFVLDINTFERMRGERRNMNQLLLSKQVREKKLSRCGFSKVDMAKAVRECRILKHKRMVSSQQVNLDNMHENMEKVTTGIRRLFVMKKSDYQRTLEAVCEQPSIVLPSKNVAALSA